jgi:hypothetical protein
MLVFDNIVRGSVISCPSIEKALTTELYSDRILGESTNKTVPAYTIIVFTGNNIAPRGDLASRSLQVHLSVDRPDPENRPFTHADPIVWTHAHRGEILGALYTLLLGNPRRHQSPDALAPEVTRFKLWWNMIGSAVEFAAARHTEHVADFTLGCDSSCPPGPIEFREMFLQGEAEDLQTNSLMTALDTFRQHWPDGAYARNVAAYLQRTDEEPAELRAALEAASGKAMRNLSPTSVSWRLKAIAGAPVKIGDKVVTLRYVGDHEGGKFTVFDLQPNS